MCQDLFIGEEETFMGRVKVHEGEFGFGCVYTDGLNEAKALVDFPGEDTVKRSFFLHHRGRSDNLRG
jgi:hypothetical protein